MWTKTLLTGVALGLACRLLKLLPLFPPALVSIMGIVAMWVGYFGLPWLFEKITVLVR
jgi:XapX domain-containing protein